MKDRSWLSQLIIQPFMIVLSILAALAVNNWQESRARAQRAADARTAFASEIRANKDLLLSDNYLPHHRRLKEEYDKAAKGETGDPETFFDTGVHPTPLRDSAWRMLSGSAILMELPSELVLALSDIYRAQDSIEKFNDGFLTAVVAPRSDRETPAYEKDVALSIRLYLNDLVSAEERLLRSYEHAIPRLSSDKPPWADGKDAAKN
jgi:type II secretory pathway pseudopilin PulG